MLTGRVFRSDRGHRAILAVILTASLGLTFPLMHAAAACGYWTSTYTATKTVQATGTGSSWGSWYTSTVHYQDYVSCPNYNISQIKVIDFTQKMKFVGGTINMDHQAYDRAVAKSFSFWGSGGYVLDWYNSYHYDYSGNGTFSHTWTVNRTIPYNVTAAVMGYWVGVSPDYGQCFGQFAHKFVGNTMWFWVSCG